MLKWLLSTIKTRADAFLGTKAIATGAGIIVSLLLPGLDPEVKGLFVVALVSIYNAVRAYQNSQIVKAQQAAQAQIEVARIAAGK